MLQSLDGTSLLFGLFTGILTSLIPIYIQQQLNKREKEIKILSDTLMYLFKSKQIYENFYNDRLDLEEAREKNHSKVEQLQKIMFHNFDNEISKNFFPNLMHCSFQLKRIRDKRFWKKFEIIFNKYGDLSEMIMKNNDISEISTYKNEIRDSIKDFVDMCHGIAKI